MSPQLLYALLKDFKKFNPPGMWNEENLPRDYSSSKVRSILARSLEVAPVRVLYSRMVQNLRTVGWVEALRNPTKARIFMLGSVPPPNLQSSNALEAPFV